MEKIKVSADCIGCGLCVATYTKYFEFNEAGFSTPKKEVIDQEDKANIVNMTQACPADAISIEEVKEEQ